MNKNQRILVAKVDLEPNLLTSFETLKSLQFLLINITRLPIAVDILFHLATGIETIKRDKFNILLPSTKAFIKAIVEADEIYYRNTLYYTNGLTTAKKYPAEYEKLEKHFDEFIESLRLFSE